MYIPTCGRGKQRAEGLTWVAYNILSVDHYLFMGALDNNLTVTDGPMDGDALRTLQGCYYGAISWSSFIREFPF